MGTRADFYVRHPGRAPEWLGSVGWNGHPESLRGLRSAKTLGAFLRKLDRMAAKRDDWTPAAYGWPWPWATSETTDFAYVFDAELGRVLSFGFGELLRPFGRRERAPFAWPNMRASGNATTPILGLRSGVIVAATYAR